MHVGQSSISVPSFKHFLLLADKHLAAKTALWLSSCILLAVGWLVIVVVMNASAAMALKSNPHSRCPVQKCAHNSVGVFNLHSDCSTWMDKCDAIFHCVYTCVQLAFFKVKPLIGRHLSQKPFQCVHDIFFIFLCLLKYTNKPNGVADYLQAIRKPIIWKANGKKCNG